jgi:hypothetical protein
VTTTASPPGLARPVSPNRRARFSDKPIRNSLLAAASLLVLSFVVLFLFASPGSGAVTFAVRSYAISGHNVVVYGKVTTKSHHGVANAKVTVYRIRNGQTKVMRVVATSSTGIYRMVFRHLHRRVLVYEKISARFRGKKYHGTTKFHVRRGHAYKVSAQLARHGSLFFFPIFTY